MPDAIKPDEIPGKDIDPETIETNAASIATIAASVRDNGAAVHTKWQGMAAVYVAPESETLLGLMAPVNSQATTAGDNLDVVSAALSQFAVDVAPIKTELDSLRTQAQWFVDNTVANGVDVEELNPAWVSTQSSYGGYSYAAYSSSSTGGTTASTDIPQYHTVHKEWHEDQDAVDRNNELIAAVNAQMVLLWEAERTAANKIRALYGAEPLHSFQSEDDPLGYGLDEIPEGTEMPWGAEVERTEGCGEATVNFVFKDFLWEGIVVGGIWGTIEGLGTLVLGYNPATGEWFSGDAYGAAWSNLGLLAAGLVIRTTPVLNLVTAADDIAQNLGGGFLPDQVRDFTDSADEALLNTGKALIAWDKWQDDPGTALGETVFNVGTILIPAGAAVTSVKTAGTAASVLSKMARVADLIDPGAWAVNGALKVGGLGLSGLKNIVGNLDFSALDDVSLGNVDVYHGTDATSALTSMIDDMNIPVEQITVRIDDGIPVLEAPGVRVELPEGAFELPGNGGAAEVTAPVREPELVMAGGQPGAPQVVNSIVDEAPPVRPETAGSGESTVVRDPETTGGSSSGTGGSHGGSSDAGGHGTGHGGEGASHGDGTGSGGSDGTGDGGAPAGGHADDGAGSGAGGDDGPTGAAGSADDSGDAGWTSSEDPDLTLSPAQRADVDAYLEVSRTAEPHVTADMTNVVGRHPEMRLEGLDFRLKGEESMYRKVATALSEAAPGQTIPVDSVLAGMKDSVRYTVIVPEGSYAAGVDGVVRDLIADGYQPYGPFKNSWGTDGYQGINSNWVEPHTGRIIEVQFHTDESFAAKMETHELYEQSRLPGQDPAVVAQLEAEQNAIFDSVNVPAGASDVAWPDNAFVVHSAPGSSTAVVDAGAVGEAVTPAQLQALRDEGWMVAFFDDNAAQNYYSGPADTIGASGRPFFMMPVEDAGVIRNAHDAARYTGMSPATVQAYTTGGEIHGLAFPADGLPYRVPTAADAMGWPHFLEGGHTAVLTEGPSAGYLVNPTHEFVTPGGGAVMPHAFRFHLVDGAWIVERVW